MCGIIGFNSRNERLGKEMTDCIAHRGPDDAGVFSDENITIGNRRLAIIDLTYAGHQPMSSNDESVFIVYNGEVYNFRELKDDFSRQGHRFKSDTDTEVILHGYEKYGIKFFHKLRGMWAVAIYDKKRQKIILSRDYFGIKPLYYFWDGHDLVFASEIKAIKKFLESKNKRTEFLKEGISQYFVLGYTISPFTVFKNIKKVMPGEIVSFDLSQRNFCSEFLKWESKLDSPNTDLKPKEMMSAFEETIRESVEKHIISDVPVGVFLSGGSDSTLIALMLKRLGAQFQAFTMRIQGRKDADYAKKIAEFAGLPYQEIAFDKTAFEKSYEDCWKYLDEPIADTSLLPSLAVSEAASKHVKVVLTGEGGDEMFLGYQKYVLLDSLQDFYGADWTIKLFDLFRRPESVFYMRYMRPIFRRMRLGYFRNFKKDLLGTYFETSSRDFDVMSRVSLYQYLHDSFQNRNLDPAFFDRKLYLPNNLLYKIDSATMVHSIEGRVPFLDRNVFAFSSSLPQEWKLKNGMGKRIIKEYLAQNLPPDLIFRKKEGFSFPLHLYKSNRYESDLRDAILFTKDVFDGYYLDSRVFKKLAENSDFLALFKEKFPDFLFATLSFYKSVSRVSR